MAWTTWRDHAAQIITRVLAENAGKSEPEVRAALRQAYPYGMRKYHPYKIWCDEIRIQLGKKPRRNVKVYGSLHVAVEPDPRQESLFDKSEVLQ